MKLKEIPFRVWWKVWVKIQLAMAFCLKAGLIATRVCLTAKFNKPILKNSFKSFGQKVKSNYRSIFP